MNDFKRALIDVAGDLSASEKAVKKAVLHKRTRKKKAYNGYYIVPVVIAVVLLVAGLQYMPKMLDLRQAAQPANVYLFEFFTALEERDGPADIETSRANGYAEMVRVIGIPEYAQSIGMTVTDEERRQAESFLEQLWKDKGFDLPLAAANISEKDFDKHVFPLLIDRVAYAKKLEEKLFRDYPKMVPAIATAYSDFIGYSYMEAHYEAKLNHFKEQQNIVTSTDGSLGTAGAVVKVEDNMFLMIQNMTMQEYEQLNFRIFVDKFAAWFMNDPNNPVKVGDYIHLKETVISEQRIGAEKAGVGLHFGIDILLPHDRTNDIKELRLTESAVLQFHEHFEKADFINEAGVDLMEPPLYTVNVEGKYYTVWQNDKEQLYILPFGGKELAAFSKYSSNKLKVLFEQTDNE